MKLVVCYTVIIIFGLSILNCSSRSLLETKELCPSVIFPRSYIYSIRGRYYGEKERQRFEALVYSSNDKIRVELLNTLGFTEIILIYNNDMLYIENRRDNIVEEYRKDKNSYSIFGVDIFDIHPGFIFSGFDLNVAEYYFGRCIIFDIDNEFIRIIPYNGLKKDYTIVRKTAGSDIIYYAYGQEKVGNCLFFRNRKIQAGDGILEYSVESYNLNIFLGEELFKWQ